MAEAWNVQTTYGPVTGLIGTRCRVALGIPYAAAPTGERRFGRPVPPDPWTDARDATVFGPTPPRVTSGIGDVLLGGPAELIGGINTESTEWLTVNVWSPRYTKGAPFPVMVWFHGGAFLRGSSAGTWYDGATFARDGVVLVSFNYRLGLEGFGYLDDAPEPCNRGLLDQLAALRWVQDNITAFGGDPGNVTLFGESAGAMSILALIRRAAADELFHKAIVQSGTGHIGQTVDDARQVMLAVGDELDHRPDAEYLAELPFTRLVEAQWQVHEKIVATASRANYGNSTIDSCGMSFLPVIDGRLLRETAFSLIENAGGGGFPLMIGTMAEENRFFVTPSPDTVNADPSLLKARLAAYGVPDGMYETYAALSRAPYSRSVPAEVFAAVMTDRLFRVPSYRLADIWVSPVFVYEIGWRSPVTIGTDLPLGACHVADLPFTWDTLDVAGTEQLISDPPAQIASAIHARWVEFARGGPMNGWPVYTWDKRQVMTFAANNTGSTQIIREPWREERQRWEGVPLPGESNYVPPRPG